MRIIFLLTFITTSFKDINAAIIRRATEFAGEQTPQTILGVSRGLTNALAPRPLKLTQRELRLHIKIPTFQFTTHLELTEDITDDDLRLIGQYCHNLRFLNLANNKNITEVGLAYLTPRFETIEQYDNTIAGGGAASSSALSTISTVSHDQTPVSNQAENPQQKLAGTRFLRTLNISNTNIREVPAILAAHPKLEELNVSFCPLTDRELENLPELPNLKILIISGTRITGNGLVTLAQRCPNLIEFYASECPINSTELENLPELLNLKILNISQTQITGNDLVNLVQACPYLRELYISSCPSINDQELEHLPEQLQNLKILDISSTQITGEGLAMLAQRCPNLMELYTYRCRNIADQGLRNFPRLLSLVVLWIIGTRITGEGLANLAQACPNLRELFSNGCPISDTGLETFPNLPNLINLSISNTQITGEGLARLAQRCPVLVYLTASHCRNIADIANRALETLPEQLPNLKRLIISDTRITGNGLVTLAQRCPNLIELYAKSIGICTNEDRARIQGLLPQCQITW